MEPDISFSRRKQDLVVTCDLGMWGRLPRRYGYHEKSSLELPQEIMMYANVTVFCSEDGFPSYAAEFPYTTSTLEIASAVLDVNVKKLTITIRDYEQQPLQLFATGNHGLFVRHDGLTRKNRLRFDLKAWISFRLPAPMVKDVRDTTLRGLGSHFESNRRRH